jgi:hypothetical protein
MTALSYNDGYPYIYKIAEKSTQQQYESNLTHECDHSLMRITNNVSDLHFIMHRN